jgi:hypothetical protein
MFPPTPDVEPGGFAQDSSVRIPPGGVTRPPVENARPPSYKPGLPTVLEDDGRDSEEECSAELEAWSVN